MVTAHICLQIAIFSDRDQISTEVTDGDSPSKRLQGYLVFPIFENLQIEI